MHGSIPTSIRLVAILLLTAGLAVPVCGESISYTSQQKRMAVERATQVWSDRFRSKSLAFPPGNITLIGYKHEGRLDVWIKEPGLDDATLIISYPLLATSGSLGPKLREGDGQIPEGVYSIELLQTEIQYHLGLLLDYPTESERAQAVREGRLELGSDIYIHGGDYSVGCLAIGDPAIEELFALVAATGKENTRTIIVPNDLGRGPARTDMNTAPLWTADLYDRLRSALLEVYGCDGNSSANCGRPIATPLF